MNENQIAFFQNLDEFRQLNIASMFPRLSKGDFCIMKVIREHHQKEGEMQPIRVAYIVEALKIPAPAVSRNLKSLEQKGLIQRKADQRDRRNTFVELTEAGTAFSQEVEAKMSDFANAVFERIGEESFKQLNYYMHQLIEVSKEELIKRKFK